MMSSFGSHPALISAAVLGWPASGQHGGGRVEGAKHVKVFYEKGRYGGWPANHGIWLWGNEILVGFMAGHHKERQGHSIDPDSPRRPMFARSLDGGETWAIEDVYENGMRGEEAETTRLEGEELTAPTEFTGAIDFTHADLAFSVRRTSNDAGTSHFYYSYDRGRHWEGPFALPNFGTPGIAARTDYIVDDKDTCTLFLTAAKADGNEGRPLCVRTTDGGRIWNMLSWIDSEPGGFAIMPASVRLSATDLLVLVRRAEKPGAWISTHLSEDNGLSWRELSPAATELGGSSNPPALVKLKDGRLCVVYGVRAEPYRMCARLSSDEGRTWSDELILRDDGGTWDLGYPRSVQRPDGKVVSVYYFNDVETGCERYIGATIWDPGH